MTDAIISDDILRLKIMRLNNGIRGKCTESIRTSKASDL